MTEKRPSQHLNTVSILVVANLLLLLFVAWSLHQHHGEQREHAEEMTQNMALTLQYRIHNDLDKIDLALQHLAATYRRYGKRGPNVQNVPDWEALLDEEKGRIDALIALRSTDVDGNVVYGLDAADRREVNIADRDDFIRHRDHADAGTTLSAPLVGRISGQWVISLTQRLEDADGRFAGILNAAIPVSHFAKVFDGLQLGNNGSVAVRDRNLHLIARVPALSSDLGTGSTRIGANFAAALADDPNRGTFHTAETGIDGVRGLHSYRRDETYGFIVDAGTSEMDYLAGWHAMLRQDLIIVALLMILSLVVARHVRRYERAEEPAQQELVKFSRELEGRVAERTVELEVEMRRNRMITEGVMDGFFVANTAGRILDCNAIYCDMLGYSRDELLTLRIPDIEANESAAEVAARIARLMDTGRDRFDTRHRRKDGGILEIEINVSLLQEQGEIRLYAFTHDIGVRKQRELELLDHRHQAERANAAKSEFLSRMSHELRTPLNAFLGFAQLLDTTKLAPDDAESVQEISKAGERLLEQVNGILDLSRIESGRLDLSIKAVSVGAVVRQCVAQVKPLAAQRGIHITLPTADFGFHVHADPRRLDQILLNLLSNAIKYNREGGRIEIEATVAEGRVRLAVKDTGKGISPENRDRLFRPFERFESAYEGIEGTGIGLALVKPLVEAMEGEIGVDSEENVGSTFWFTLPLAEGEAVKVGAGETAPTHALPQSPVVSAVPVDTKRILYIEDNPANRKLMEKLLVRLPGISLQLAEDGASGLAAAQKQLPELILLDINLPDMDGFAVLAGLRTDERTREIPVIAVTANAMMQDVERGYEVGFDAYLTKPILFGVLRETIASTFNKNAVGNTSSRMP